MPKTGKRFEWEVGLASHNPLAALFQDYDWADEVLARPHRPRLVSEGLRQPAGSRAHTATNAGRACS